MRNVFINFTNHPSELWGAEEKHAARQYGEIVELPFPAVDPQKDRDYITKLAEECVSRMLLLNPAAVLCQGEFCLVYQVVSRLKEEGITVLSACSERITTEEQGKKVSVFKFRQFREY